jgi:hypothetical protein
MLDVLRLIPKLNVRLMAACRARNIGTDFHRTAAGYSHTYFDADGIALGILSEIPSDHDIAMAARSAFNEASALWELLGYCHSPSSSSIAHEPPLLTNDVDDSEEIDDLDDANNTAFQDGDRRFLREALDTSRQVSGLDAHARAHLDECTYAAACLDVADQERM